MSKLEQDFTIFGDYYFNSTRTKINELALEFKKYSQGELMIFLKNRMQDIIVHLLGCTTFDDATMISSPKKSYYYLVNNALGRKKLTEFFAFLEEIDKIEQFHNLDKVHFKDNENDQVLLEYEKTTKAAEKIYLKYLHVDSITDFFATVITIMENETLGKDYKEMVTIPDPASFDFNAYYYKDIDTMEFIGDEKNKERVREKHKTDGKSIDARKWIKEYLNRFAIIHPQEIEEVGFSDAEMEIIIRIINENLDYVRKIKFGLISIRYNIQQIAIQIGETITEEELDTYENQYIVEKIASIANIPLDTKKNKSGKEKLYITILLVALALGTNKIMENATKTLENCEQNIRHKIALEIPSEETPTSSIDPKNHLRSLLTIPNPYQENPFDTYLNPENYKPFQLGEIIDLKDNPVPFYNSATSLEPIDFIDEQGVVIGYFAIQKKGNQNILIKSCRTQKDVEKFMENYDSSLGEITWRCAINTTNVEIIRQWIENGVKIDPELTTCFIDYQERTLTLNEEAKVTK